jgi:hypothetical protein
MQTLRRFFSCIVVIVFPLLMQSWAQPGFRTAPGYITGPNAYSIAVEDFNNDGIDDMAVVNYNGGNAPGGTVTILLGKGDGTFTISDNYTVGLGPRFIAAGVFTNSGKWDLVTANELDSTVSVLIGNGDGTFQPAIPYFVGTNASPWNVQVANFVSSNPSVEDLVVADNTGSKVYILIGNGDGTFQEPAQPFSTGSGTGPLFTRVADFNNDGILDLAVADFEPNNGNNVSVLLGKGDGTFGTATIYSFNNSSQDAIDSDSIFAADYNGDGNLDLAVSNETPNGAVTVLFGNGNGTFQTSPTPVNYPAGAHPRSVVSYDFNKDGILDLLTGNDGSDDVTFLQGLGGGTFAAPVHYGAGYQPRYVAMDDFNKDGNEDLAVANYGSGNVTVLLGFGDGSFNSSVAAGTGNNPISVVVADFNLDGKLDQAVVNSKDNTIGVELGNGDGTFQTMVTYPTGTKPVYAAAADVNGDGYPDLIVVNQQNNNISVFLNSGANGNGTFQTAKTYSAGSSPTAVAVGAFVSGSNSLDLAVTNSSGVTVLLNNGSGVFTSSAPLSDPNSPQSVAVGDFNGDGILDLVVANKGNKTVSVFLGNGDGAFQTTAENSTTGTQPYSVAVGDFNLDGKLDVAVANSGSNNVSVLLGNGTGFFTTASGSPYPVGSTSTPTPEFVAVADYNGDGKPDLAVANQGEADVSVLYGNGDGTFQSAVNFIVGTNPTSIAVGDVNNDGALDLEVANFNSNTVTALLNVGGTILKTTSSPNPSVPGQSVTFTTTVAASLRDGGTPTGMVTFEDGSSPFGSAQVISGAASLIYSGLTAGTHTINALYSGDTTFNPHFAPPYTQTVNGSGPAVSLSPSSLTFATTVVGSSSPAQSITLTNTGNATLDITLPIQITGTNSAEFKLVTSSSPCGSTLNAGASCIISVSFRPSAPGNATAAVSITDNAPGSPQTAPLSGTGTIVKVSPSTISFRNVQVGKSSNPRKITVTNVGKATLTFTGKIAIGGADPSDFTQTNTCQGTLNGGASCSVSVVFSPLTTGQLTGTVLITDNGGGSPQQVLLSGTGD